MYARYTEFEFDADDRDHVLAVWSDDRGPQRVPPARLARLHDPRIAGHARRAAPRDAVGVAGGLRALLLGPEHVGLSEAIKASGMRGESATA